MVIEKGLHIVNGIEVEVFREICQQDFFAILSMYNSTKHNVKNSLKSLKKLGQGITASVYKYKNYAIKLSIDDTYLYDIDAMKDLQGINGIPSIYIQINGSCIVMEEIDGDTLSYISMSGSGQIISVNTMKQLEDITENILKRKYIPCDIHCGNIMIERKTKKVYMIDFGMYTKSKCDCSNEHFGMLESDLHDIKEVVNEILEMKEIEAC